MTVILETERLYLRELVLTDSIHFYNINSDPEVIKYARDITFKTLEEATLFLKEHIDSRHLEKEPSLSSYAVIKKDDHLFLGWCGLKYHPEKRYVDIDYRFYKKYWNQNYVTESVQGVVEFAFSILKLQSLVARSPIENMESHQNFENIGMTMQTQITCNSQAAFLYKLDNPDYTIKTITAQNTWPVRHPVLRAGRPLKDVYMEADEMETTFHLGIFYKQSVVGVASFMEDTHPDFTGLQSRLRGMAVLPEYRNRGLAELLLKRGEDILRQRGRTLLWFNARIIALRFYKKLGYQKIGSEFEIPNVGSHYKMKKEL